MTLERCREVDSSFSGRVTQEQFDQVCKISYLFIYCFIIVKEDGGERMSRLRYWTIFHPMAMVILVLSHLRDAF